MNDQPNETPRQVRKSRTAADTAVSRTVTTNTARLRHARGLTQRALIKIIQNNGHNMHLSALSCIELGRHSTRGLRAVTVDELIWIAEAFGVNPSRLLGTNPCPTCDGTPPTGFTCKGCGAGADHG